MHGMEKPVNLRAICATTMHDTYMNRHIPEQFPLLVLIHISLRLPELDAHNTNPLLRTQ